MTPDPLEGPKKFSSRLCRSEHSLVMVRGSSGTQSDFGLDPPQLKSNVTHIQDDVDYSKTIFDHQDELNDLH